LIFSTNLRKFPKELGRISNTGDCIVGDKLKPIIDSNGFDINEDKVTLRDRSQRQMVTGLVVNDRPNVSRDYIRTVRSMLCAYQHYGLEEAAKYFFEKGLDKKNRPLSILLEEQPEKYKQVLRGKITYIGHIRGWGDMLYLKTVKKARQIDNTFKFKTEVVKVDVGIFTEGETDKKHLEAALEYFRNKDRFSNLELNFLKPPKKGGQSKEGDRGMLVHCEALSSNPQSKPTIFMFDRDNDEITSKVESSDGDPKNWTNGVYSFAIPQPGHRSEEFCIEKHYKDSDLQKRDKNGRRLFLREEFEKFDEKTGIHKKESKLYTPSYQKKTLVIDKVYNKPENVALRKNEFAEYISKGEPPFNNMDFEAFEKIFEIIEKIFKQHHGLI
jgi:RNA-directed DNA polymerase